ncbi:MAG: Asp-tRNA(Asn)/Glu-tRNA(Gln) amidotransferase subunit GatB [Candidatus Saccharimonadales bacterium]
MVSKEIRDQYTATIGVECHVQLKTKTKLFAAVSNDARGAEPNSLISHICLGMPGALPVLNEEAVRLATKMAFALNTRPEKFSKFDRKHYFYPDLPKGYQISQFEQPIIASGHVDIEVAGQTKRINITRAHLEEDAGKNTHPAGKDYSLVDLNRAGTPLLEIVSEPELHSSAEVKAYARELYLLAKYADVSDADLYHGNMRFDVNVSVSKDPKKLGTRSETKNLNSFKSVEKAVEFEIDRQIELLEKGQRVVQETRGWDEAKQKTVSQRSKEEAHDYRYMPEPDVPPTVLDDKYINDVKKTMPVLPDEMRQSLKSLGLNRAAIDVLLSNKANALQVNKIADKEHAKRIANWIINTYDPDADVTEDVEVDSQRAIKLSMMVANNEVSSTAAREVWLHLFKSADDPEKIAKERNLIQVSDESAIEKIVFDILGKHPQAAADVKKGEMKAIGFLVGQVMKVSHGQANPQLAQKLIKKQLGL